MKKFYNPGARYEFQMKLASSKLEMTKMLEINLQYSKYSKIINTFLFLFTNKILFRRAQNACQNSKQGRN